MDTSDNPRVEAMLEWRESPDGVRLGVDRSTRFFDRDLFMEHIDRELFIRSIAPGKEVKTHGMLPLDFWRDQCREWAFADGYADGLEYISKMT